MRALITLTLFLMALQVNGQRSLSLGLTLGMGASPFSVHPVIYDSAGQRERAVTDAIYGGGFFTNYFISEKIGFETGLHWNLQDYSLPQRRYTPGTFFSNMSDFRVVNFYVPFLVGYQMNAPHNHYRTVRLLGGTTLDFLSTGYLNNYRPAGQLHKVMMALCFKTFKPGRKRWTYGFEYQYSLGRFSLTEQNFVNRMDSRIESRINALTFFVSYQLIEETWL